MKIIQLSASIIFLLTIILLACSCNNASNKNKENNISQTSVTDISREVNSSAGTGNNNKQNDTSATEINGASAVQDNNTDSMLAQAMSTMFGKNDSGILRKLGGGSNLDSMMNKMQSMMGGKNRNPGDAMAKKILDLQLGQMKDDNPLKSVANGMMEAQKNGTAGPSKTYTATYAPEQPANFSVPVSGQGNTIMFHYTGGNNDNGKKDGLWKNIYINTTKTNGWNIYSEGYMVSSALNMNIHATSLASIHENYTIILNDQYKKYAKQPKNDLGKNEFNVQVRKVGDEKMYGYNCVHIRTTYTLKALHQTEQEQEDEWYSPDVPGAQFLSPQFFENHSPAVVQKIINTGCKGVLVKSVLSSSGSPQLMQLSSIIQKDMPDSTFILPANYQEDKNAALYDIQ